MKWSLHRSAGYIHGRAYYSANGKEQASMWRRYCILPVLDGYRVTREAYKRVDIIRFFRSWREARTFAERRGF